MDASESPVPLQAIVHTIAAIQDVDAGVADAALARLVLAFAAILLEGTAYALAEHGHKILEIDPNWFRGSASESTSRS